MLLAPGGCGWVKHSPRKQLEIASSLLLNPANGVSYVRYSTTRS